MADPLASFTTGADDLARVLANVSLVAKKAANYPTARIRLTAGTGEPYTDRLELSGTDGYCAAVDGCLGDYTGPPGGVTLEIPRDALDVLEKCARPDRKAVVRLDWHPKDGLILYYSGGREAAQDGGEHPRTWAMVDQLFALKEDGPFELPELCAVDMRLLARFWRVKSSNNEHVADLMFTGGESPILVKLGQDFKALVMPIKRERFKTNIDPEGLW